MSRPGKAFRNHPDIGVNGSAYIYTTAPLGGREFLLADGVLRHTSYADNGERNSYANNPTTSLILSDCFVEVKYYS